MIGKGGAGTISGFAPPRQDPVRRGEASVRAVSSNDPRRDPPYGGCRFKPAPRVGCEGDARKTPSSSRRTPGPIPRCSINRAPAAETDNQRRWLWVPAEKDQWVNAAFLMQGFA